MGQWSSLLRQLFYKLMIERMISLGLKDINVFSLLFD